MYVTRGVTWSLPKPSPSASPPLNFGGDQVDHKEKVQVYRGVRGILR